MKILITGASGFVGSKVLTELKKRYNNDEIVALSSKPIEGIKTLLHNNYQFDENIIRSLEDIDVLLHIGASTPKTSLDANNIGKNNSNIYNTEKLLAYLKKLKKIIFISTLDVYKESDCITEDTITDPVSIYGWSKLYCEKMVEAYAKQNNIIYQILRLGHVYGEGEEKYRKILPLTIKKVISNEPVEIWGDGQAIRTFIYIDDAARAIVNAINLPESQIINIVGEEQITINALVKKIIDISKKDIKVSHIQSNTPNRNLIFDNTRLKKYLLSELSPFNEGLKKEYEYMEKLNANIL